MFSMAENRKNVMCPPPSSLLPLWLVATMDWHISVLCYNAFSLEHQRFLRYNIIWASRFTLIEFQESLVYVRRVKLIVEQKCPYCVILFVWTFMHPSVHKYCVVPLRNFRRSHNIIMMVMDDALKKWRRCRWFHRKKITWCHSRWGKCVTLKWQLNKWEFALNWKTSKKEMAFHHDDFWKKQHVWSIFPIFLSYGHCLSVQCTSWIYLRDMNVHYVETEILSWQKWP